MRKKENLGNVKSLGTSGTDYAKDYNPGLLEWFKNLWPKTEYTVELEAFEFTSLCPKTGQPDFATIKIRYIPREKLVESKSLKLYLGSFRNRGDFHEDCINMIMKDLKDLLDPNYIEVHGLFNSRGGISINPFVNYGRDGGYKKTAFIRRIEVMGEVRK